jgi:hypothetical protein
MVTPIVARVNGKRELEHPANLRQFDDAPQQRPEHRPGHGRVAVQRQVTACPRHEPPALLSSNTGYTRTRSRA